MAYERMFRSIAFGIFSFFDVLVSLAFAAWRFIDIPANVSMAMDALSRPFSTIAGKASAARAFVSRALAHDRYIGGYFDQGRMPA